VVAVSTIYRVPALGSPEQPPYYNGVVEIETGLSPGDLKREILRAVEDELGRTRSADRYAARTIDLDLLLYDDPEREMAASVPPDPEIARRPFLAIPLRELAPGLVLPGTGKTMEEIAAAFASPDLEPLIPYTERLRKDILHVKKSESSSRGSKLLTACMSVSR
jgi:2-amino-4-hydroxy-6-hydroxymethyldihydropteridine diphosphokinase